MNKKTGGKSEVRMFWGMAFVINFLLLGAAILQINAYIHSNSLLKDYQKQITMVSGQNDELQVKISQRNSLQNFDQFVQAQEGSYEKVDVDSVQYINAADNELASR